MTDKPCCNEYRCARKKPFKIRRGGLTNRVFLITDYTNDGTRMTAHRKHDITEEIEAFMRSEGWTPPEEPDGEG